MRGLIYAIAFAILLGIARDHIDWDRVLIPYRIARLVAEPADSHLLMPVQGVAPRAVANTWHAKRSGGRKHEGQDIFARRGTPVLAAADGVVTRLGGGALGGNAVFVTGRGSRTYYYAHLDAYAEGIEPGALVNRGTLLGYVGNTGNARTTPPHLHFGVYGPSGPLNPLPLLQNARPRAHRVESA